MYLEHIHFGKEAPNAFSVHILRNQKDPYVRTPVEIALCGMSVQNGSSHYFEGYLVCRVCYREAYKQREAGPFNVSIPYRLSGPYHTQLS